MHNPHYTYMYYIKYIVACILYILCLILSVSISLSLSVSFSLLLPLYLSFTLSLSLAFLFSLFHTFSLIDTLPLSHTHRSPVKPYISSSSTLSLFLTQTHIYLQLNQISPPGREETTHHIPQQNQ